MNKISLARLRFFTDSSRPAKHQEINKNWLGLETIFLAAVIILFNIMAFDIGIFGFVTSAADPESFIPLKAPAVRQILPWLNLWWAAALVLNLANLRLGRWYPLTRLVDIGLGLLGIGVLVSILTMGPAFVLDPAWAAQQSAAGVSLVRIKEAVLPIINTSLTLAIGAAMVGLAAASLRKVRYLARSWRLQGLDIDILFRLSLILVAIFVMSAPSATMRADASILDLSVPLALTALLVIIKTISPRRI